MQEIWLTTDAWLLPEDGKLAYIARKKLPVRYDTDRGSLFFPEAVGQKGAVVLRKPRINSPDRTGNDICPPQ